jgi:hypothetical protein
MAAVSPSGRSARADPVEDQEERAGKRGATHSGRLLLRMPRSLHAKLAALAERDGVSLNSLITSTLESAVKEREQGGRSGGKASAQASRRSQTRFLTVALVANFVIVGLAAAIAIALLVTAWRHGW